MKTHRTKRLVSSFALAFIGLCLAGQANATVFTLSGGMDVFQALTNPANVGNGTGTIAGSYDDVTNLLDYTITWQDLTAPVSNMHFHLGPPGVSGGVSLGIPGPWASPQTGMNILLNSVQESELLAGDWYVNVHTNSAAGGGFPGGEIRGQVIVTALVSAPATLMLLATGLVGLGCRRARRS